MNPDELEVAAGVVHENLQGRVWGAASEAELRDLYAGHLIAISDAAPQLLNAFEYDQSLMRGPPFSVEAEEVARLYGQDYQVTLLERVAIDGGLRGKPAHDAVWLLRPKPATEADDPGV